MRQIMDYRAPSGRRTRRELRPLLVRFALVELPMAMQPSIYSRPSEGSSRVVLAASSALKALTIMWNIRRLHYDLSERVWLLRFLHAARSLRGGSICLLT